MEPDKEVISRLKFICKLQKGEKINANFVKYCFAKQHLQAKSSETKPSPSKLLVLMAKQVVWLRFA